MITYFSEKQIGFAQAVREIAEEVEREPATREFYSVFILAVADSYLEYRTKELAPSDANFVP